MAAELLHLPSLVVQIINLSLILFVLNRWVFKPYLAIIDIETAKRKKIATAEATADEMLQQARNESDTLVSEARKLAQSLRKDAEKIAKQDASLLISDAKAEAEALRNKAATDIASEEKKMQQGLQKHVLDIALRLNQKLFKAQPQQQKELLAQQLSSLDS
jgi:F-type H+-transporting ATPase subunit b